MDKLEMIYELFIYNLPFKNFLEKLKISEEYFEKLIELIQKIGVSKERVKIIKKNLPKNYNWKNLSDEIKKYWIYDKIISGSYDCTIKINREAPLRSFALFF